MDKFQYVTRILNTNPHYYELREMVRKIDSVSDDGAFINEVCDQSPTSMFALGKLAGLAGMDDVTVLVNYGFNWQKSSLSTAYWIDVLEKLK